MPHHSDGTMITLLQHPAFLVEGYSRSPNRDFCPPMCLSCMLQIHSFAIKKQWVSSGITSPCHGVALGSIPGQCTQPHSLWFIFFILLRLLEGSYFSAHMFLFCPVLTLLTDLHCLPSHPSSNAATHVLDVSSVKKMPCLWVCKIPLTPSPLAESQMLWRCLQELQKCSCMRPDPLRRRHHLPTHRGFIP